MIPKVLLIVLKRTMTAWPSGVSAVCLFIYLSTPSVMRLRVDPPAQFFDSRPEWSADRQEREEWLARAYWRRGVGYVLWRYEFGEKLPVELEQFCRRRGGGQAALLAQVSRSLEPSRGLGAKLRVGHELGGRGTGVVSGSGG